MFVPGKPFQLRLIFAYDEGKEPTLVGDPLKCFTCVGSGLTHTRLERLARDKHSSVLQTLVNYSQKSCISLRPGKRITLLHIGSHVGREAGRQAGRQAEV